MAVSEPLPAWVETLRPRTPEAAVRAQEYVRRQRLNQLARYEPPSIEERREPAIVRHNAPLIVEYEGIQ